MQQQRLFDFKKIEKTIKVNNITLHLEKQVDNNIFFGVLDIPSGKFLVRFSTVWWKIESFELIDFTAYMYTTVSVIKMLKELIEAILLSSWTNLEYY